MMRLARIYFRVVFCCCCFFHFGFECSMCFIYYFVGSICTFQNELVLNGYDVHYMNAEKWTLRQMFIIYGSQIFALVMVMKYKQEWLIAAFFPSRTAMPLLTTKSKMVVLQSSVRKGWCLASLL